MTYYAGDYYRGDYYRGDLFGLLKRGARVIKGAAKGFARGGPAGAVVGAVGALTGKPPAAPPTQMMTTRPPMITPPMVVGSTFAPTLPSGKQGVDVPKGMGVPEPGAAGAIQRFLPFGQSGYGAAPPGYHINKAYLRFLRAQAAGRHVENPFNEPRAVNLVVRNRRTNPLNPRALKRSVARQRGAVGLMRSVLAGTGYTIQRKGLGKKRGPRRK